MFITYKSHVTVFALLYLGTNVIPSIRCQAPVCSNAIASGDVEFNRGPSNARRRDELLNIAHGNIRTTKCRFLTSVLDRTGLRGDCGEALSLTCPVQRPVSTSLGPTGEIRGFAIPEPLECDISVPYRSLDGSCNNLGYPRRGQAGITEIRLLPNAYDDGRGSPRTRSCNGGRLPSARTVSNMVHSAGPNIVFEPRLSLMVMQMGQFLIHDVVLTKVFTRDDGSPLLCCTVDRNHPQCNPIRIPEDDLFFEPGSCMNFARSNASLEQNRREVINSQTSYFDLSLVYGSSTAEAHSLRSFIGGRLKEVQDKLPTDFSDSTCVLSRPFDPIHYYCPVAGDGRVNEHPGLASMHTIFMREHNRLADGLSRVNPHWNDERLYQEARKINIGQWQHILYAEFLPQVLGPDVINRYRLNVLRYGFNDNYNPTVDATVSNAFAAAVFRYGHSQVHDLIGMLNARHHQIAQPLERHFFETDWYHARNGTGLEDVLKWFTATRCPFTDRKIQDSIRLKLFLDDNGNSLDLVSLNVHRGRDHGLPGYTVYRKLCGLSHVHHFGTGRGGLINHDAKTARLLQLTYTCPNDIDLFTGLLTERRTRGSLLGPTWQCLLASEFKRLRDGDRFFYERGARDTGFNLNQLNSIKTVTTSAIFCLNTDVQYMQSNAYLRPDIKSGRYTKNVYRHCNRFKGVNLNLWRN